MENHRKHTLWTNLAMFLAPEYLIIHRLDHKITGKYFGNLFLKNLIFFAVCSLITILVESSFSHDFTAWELLIYPIVDIVLALIFAFIEIQWIKFRLKDKEHLAQYRKDNN